jgi:hypothetical protein
MQTIKKDELFHSLGDFLKSKGIELNDGSYTSRIQKGCNLLTDVINGTEKTVRQTKVQVNQALDQLRQSIHKRTAPKPPPEYRTPPQGKKPAKPRVKRAPASAKTPPRKRGKSQV